MNLKYEYGLPNRLTGKSFADASKAIEKMFNAIFNGITNTVEIVHSTQDDPNIGNNQATLPTIIPHN